MRVVPAQPDDDATVGSIYLRSRAAAETTGALPVALHSAEETDIFVRDVVLAQRQVWRAIEAERPVDVLVVEGDDFDWLFATNAAARTCYEARGFRAVRETDGADIEEHCPDVRSIWGSHRERLR